MYVKVTKAMRTKYISVTYSCLLGYSVYMVSEGLATAWKACLVVGDNTVISRTCLCGRHHLLSNPLYCTYHHLPPTPLSHLSFPQ